jgi:hypothetical protein
MLMVKFSIKEINNVFDGNEFWKQTSNSHSKYADMIEGIDLYTNYSGFAIASGGDKGVR